MRQRLSAPEGRGLTIVALWRSLNIGPEQVRSFFLENPQADLFNKCIFEDFPQEICDFDSRSCAQFPHA